MDDKILYLSDDRGRQLGVYIPLAIWQRLQPVCQHLLEPAPSQKQPEPLANFAEFMQCWDFRYPYDPAVCCPHCGASTSDWRNDPARPFTLANANFGGLLVFHCRHCGATIRHKYFKDHVCHELTLPA